MTRTRTPVDDEGNYAYATFWQGKGEDRTSDTIGIKRPRIPLGWVVHGGAFRARWFPTYSWAEEAFIQRVKFEAIAHKWRS